MKMIKKDMIQKTIIAILFALLITTWYSLFVVVFNPDTLKHPPLYGPGGSSTSPYSGGYKIDPSAILKFIDSGQSPIFLHETAQIPNSNASRSLKWAQSEYLKVAFTFFEFVWKDTYQHWTINSMTFDRECEENPVGFESAAFLFDQLIYKKGFRYNTRAIEISLSDSMVSWGSGGGYPRPLFGATEFDLDDLKITADDALKIAEESGGKVARQSVQNKCRIFLSLDESWHVHYSGLPFEIYIDPYTGKIINPH